MSEPGLQRRYAPASRCFGCGPANAEGLRIESHLAPDGGEPGQPGQPGELRAEWQPLPHHAAFDGVLNGGIIGTLLDCHANWAAAMRLMHDRDLPGPPGCVTADYAIRLRRPTPVDRPLRLRAWPVSVEGDRVVVDAEVSSGGIITATCRGTFVAVGPDHPAYERW
ncbi:MAG TPA: PaaI family thioesterase [Candidatus Limnocylindrales bacterium]|nr:PaaI family thioesterase [Candidatus Limnocylindrales bacterium]